MTTLEKGRLLWSVADRHDKRDFEIAMTAKSTMRDFIIANC